MFLSPLCDTALGTEINKENLLRVNRSSSKPAVCWFYSMK